MKGILKKLKEFAFEKNNYGVTHLLMSMAVMIPVAILFTNTIVPYIVGYFLSLYFALKELNGPGDLWGYPKGYTGSFSNWDRRMDWILPLIGNLIVCMVVYYV